VVNVLCKGTPFFGGWVMNSDVLTSSLTRIVVAFALLALELGLELLSDRRCGAEAVLGLVLEREVGWEFRATGGDGADRGAPILDTALRSSMHGGGAKLVLAFAPRSALAAEENNEMLARFRSPFRHARNSKNEVFSLRSVKLGEYSV